MTETRFEEIQRYVRFGDEDARALVAFRPVAAPHFTRIAREFYERIREHEDAHAVFSGEAQIERLQRSLVQWMDRLLSGVYDEDYYARTLAIGHVHVRVGLPQRYMLTAMALIRVALEDVAAKELGAQAEPARRALTRLLDLDLAIMLESYRQGLEDQTQRRDDMEARSLRTDLARAVRLYETAIDATPSLVVGIDSGGAIRLFNRAAQLLTGYAFEDVFGASFVDTIVAEDARPKDGPLIEALLAGPPRDVDEDSIARTRSGKLRDVRWHFSRIDTAIPGDLVLFAVGTDVTDTRAAAEHLHRHERLAALGTLAAGLAHEIRNPLNGAQLHVAFLQRALRKNNQDPEMLDAAGVVASEIKRLADLVAEFLDFARPSVLTKRRLVLQTVLDRVVDLTAALASTHGIVLTTDAPPQELIVVADAGKIEQVLLNLVRNAIEALQAAGTGNVIIRVRRQPRFVLVEVEDDGPGLPTPDAPVFDA
ncbi:MAG TPA: protoglobin domain-containing protein, partial [Labilithrix sp.]|nr:protoglobin domain-containing protein [Labilithrix sp.]